VVARSALGAASTRRAEQTPSITPTPSATETPSATATPTFPADAYVAVEALNVRAGPDTLHPIRAGIGRATPVAIEARNGEASWFAVRDPSGKSGWVAGRFLSMRRTLDTIPTAPTPTLPPTLTPTPEPMDPTLPVVLSPPRVAQGDPLLVRLRAPGASQVVAALSDMAADLQPVGSDAFAGLLGVPREIAPGQQPVYLTYIDGGGEAADRSVMLEITSAGYTTETIAIDVTDQADRARAMTVEVREAEAQHLALLTSAVSPERLWAGRWTAPITPSISSPFGGVRSYNEGALQGRHSGVDFAAPPGTPVRAPAAGRVVATEMLDVLGNAVWLDHGWGVYSGYGHLAEAIVEVGDLLLTGDVLGTVGATGAATGPHLHWETRIHGVPVQPMQWLLRDVAAVP